MCTKVAAILNFNNIFWLLDCFHLEDEYDQDEYGWENNTRNYEQMSLELESFCTPLPPKKEIFESRYYVVSGWKQMYMLVYL